MAKIAVITKTAPKGAGGPQANLVQNEFDKLIWNKGYDVLYEKALKCPCKSKSTGQQSDCKNCGGTMWIFINPTNTKMVLQSMSAITKYKEWSEEKSGTVSITCMSNEELCHMDRITVLKGNSIFHEVLFLKTDIADTSESVSESQSTSDSVISQSVYFFNTIYDIKQVLYIGIFNGTQNKLVPLKYGIDFTYIDNKIFLSTETAEEYVNPSLEEQDISITLRYKHAPQYHVLDIPRETIQSNTKFGPLDTEKVIDLPIHAVGRRSHYVLDAENFDGTRILNNDNIVKFEDLNPPLKTC